MDTSLTKHCAKCGAEKPIEQFRVRSKAHNWYDCYCIPCRSTYFKGYYAKHRERYRKNITANKTRLKQIRYDAINQLKEVPCMDCGGHFPAICMDFDHRSDKVLPISRMVTLCRSMDIISAEIAKCDVICANCHRIRTYKGKHYANKNNAEYTHRGKRIKGPLAYKVIAADS